MNMTDLQIKDIILRRLEHDSNIDSTNITVEVANGQVRLTGTVPSFVQKNDVSWLLWSIRWVKAIDNQLQTTFPPEFAVPADSVILANAKTAISLNAYTTGLDPEISVNKGIVTLSGVVDAHWKAKKIENIVGELAGVKDVTSLLMIVPTEDIMDEIIANAVIDAFKENQYIEEDKIVVMVAGGKVTLQGTVLSAKTAFEACECASRIRGVKDVINEISVG